MPDTTTEELTRFSEVFAELSQASNEHDTVIFSLIERVDIKRGKMSVVLDQERLATLLGVSNDRIDSDLLVTSSKFQHRKCGVETRIILACDAAPRDETLFRNSAPFKPEFSGIPENQDNPCITFNSNC